MNNRSVGIILLSVLVVLALTAVPIVQAHGNHVEADDQVSSDGAVVVENVFTVTDSWLVVHRIDNGSLGEPIGHALVESTDDGEDVEVEINGSAWANWNGSQEVAIVLHNEDGDGTFSPDSDPILESVGEPVAVRIQVQDGERQAYVGTSNLSPQQINRTATVRRTVLPVDGFLVISDPADGSVIDAVSLPAGSHDNVTLTLSDAVLRQKGSEFSVNVSLYRDDGDGIFSGEEPIRAGNETVSTVLNLETTVDLTPTETPSQDHDGDTATTPTPDNDSDGHDDDHSHETETPSQDHNGDTATATTPESDSDGHDDDHSHETEHGEMESETTSSMPTENSSSGNATDGEAGPGFGAVIALIGLTVGLMILRARSS